MKLVVDIDGVVHRQLSRKDHPFDKWLPGHVSARARYVKPAPPGASITCFVCIQAWENHLRFITEATLRG